MDMGNSVQSFDKSNTNQIVEILFRNTNKYKQYEKKNY